MDKLQLTGRYLGRVFNTRSGCVCAMQLNCFETKLSSLMLKTRPKQLLGSLPLDIALPDMINSFILLAQAQLSNETSGFKNAKNLFLL